MTTLTHPVAQAIVDTGPMDGGAGRSLSRSELDPTGEDDRRTTDMTA